MDQCLTLLGTAMAVVSHTERPSLGSTIKEKKKTKNTCLPYTVLGLSWSLEIITLHGSLRRLVL